MLLGVEGSEERKVDRVLANHSLSSTASQGRSNIPLSFFPALGIRPPGVEGTKEINKITYFFLLIWATATAGPGGGPSTPYFHPYVASKNYKFTIFLVIIASLHALALLH